MEVSLTTLFFTLLMGVVMVALPRRHALTPLILTAVYVPLGERVMVGGLDFTMLRILILFGWIRLAMRGESRRPRWNSVDRLMLYWVVASATAYVLFRRDGDAIVSRLGFAYDAFGVYWLGRCLIRDVSDIRRLAIVFAVGMVPVAAGMFVERLTGRNVFSVLGGVPETTMIRDGKLRCQGPFGHPILAGTFGATTLFFFPMLWWTGWRGRVLAVAGAVASAAVTVASVSSGPLMTFVLGIVALAMWPLRNWLRVVRWGIVVVLIILHMLMKAPVWYLISKFSAIAGGGHGWYRSYLIDQAIAHFREWWLLGTDYTAHWIPTNITPADPKMCDITNRYVREAVDGGLLGLILFLVLLGICYQRLGRGRRQLEREPMRERMVPWSLGCVLFAHSVAFISVRYFDQNIVFWYVLLAMAALYPLPASGSPNGGPGGPAGPRGGKKKEAPRAGAAA